MLNSDKPESLIRIISEDSIEKIFKIVCFDDSKKFTALTPEIHYICIGKGMCPLITTSIPYDNVFISGATKRGFKYKRSFDIGYFT